MEQFLTHTCKHTEQAPDHYIEFTLLVFFQTATECLLSDVTVYTCRKRKLEEEEIDSTGNLN